MDKIRRGRPKSKKPTRNKRINFPVSEVGRIESYTRNSR